jgi:hypothetical protein
LLRPGAVRIVQLALTDAGGGIGRWTVGVTRFADLSVTAPAEVTVPGALGVRVLVNGDAAEGDRTGFITLSHGADQRRIPFWLRVERPRLPTDRRLTLARPGLHRGDTSRGVARVSTYRYPAVPADGAAFPVRLTGREIVYRVRIPRGLANFGVAVVARDRGVRVEPRVVRNADENRLAGYAALPFDENPYRASFGDHRTIAGVVLPTAGNYDIVFDTPTNGRTGGFTFRYWLNDSTPPVVRFVGVRGRALELAVSDRGAGVDPSSLHAHIDGTVAPVTFAAGIARLSLSGLSKGPHVLIFSAADFQETKNMENVRKILPNTRVVRQTFVVP